MKRAADIIQAGCIAVIVVFVVFIAYAWSVSRPELPPPTLPPPGPTPTPVPTPVTGRWRVDIVNGPRPIIIRFDPVCCMAYPTAPDGVPSPIAWQVEANQRVTLFDQATNPAPGSFDLVQASNDPSPLDHCHVFQTISFPAESFTIRLEGDATGPKYSGTIDLGLPDLLSMASPADVSIANCSG